MRSREFIVEARVMDPTFSILPLGGIGVNDHQTGRMAKNKGRNRQVLFPLEPPKQCCWENENCYCLIHDATEELVRYFLTYLKRKGVHINYAQLGMVETVTLGWIGQAYPSFGCRDETKE
jgi:hypothetical protein